MPPHSQISNDPWPSRLIWQHRHALAIIGFLFPSTATHAQSPAKQETRVSWQAALPCAIDFAERSPNTPEIGMALFKFSCPSHPPQYASGIIQIKPEYQLITTAPAQKGAALSEISYIKQPGEWISRAIDLPLGEDEISKQARIPLPAGSPLFAKDFESKRLWIGGESIMIKLMIGNVSTTLDGTSLSAAKNGDTAKAKVTSGKTMIGVATLCANKPCLLIKQ